MRRLWPVLLTFAACSERAIPPGQPGGKRDATVTSTPADASVHPDATAGDNPDATVGNNPDASTPGGLEGLSIMTRMAGLWSGPATGTRLGTFPRVIMDFRPVDEKTLFARVDLDKNNSLRMAFFVEDIAGTETLIFRNGGLFMGLSRDTRLKLVEVDEARGRFRFCEILQGCAYNEAIFDFSAPTGLTLDVTVRGMMHEHWTPTRQEMRTLPTPFPTPGAVPGGSPFPPMPSLKATVTWATPLAAPADAMVLLSTGDCSFTTCVISRHHLGAAAAGATSVVLDLDQIHPGDYKIVGFLDRDRNVGTTYAPSSGDGVSVPNQALTIAPTGMTMWSGNIVFDLP